jgi:phosphomannomutase/phosphoglucomutase
MVAGRDVRLDSPALAAAAARGLNDGGAAVIDIGLCGTEEVYFQTAHRGIGGGIMVTASHNPMDCNGMKLVRQDARPISGDTGLRDIETLVEAGGFPPSTASATRRVDAGKSASNRAQLVPLTERPCCIQKTELVSSSGDFPKNI